jgi:hypothetical protein
MTRPHSLAYRVANRLDVFAPAVSLAGPDCHAKSNNKFPPVQASSPATDVLPYYGQEWRLRRQCGVQQSSRRPWITVDPSNPAHLVGMSKFFFDSFRQRKKGCGCHSNLTETSAPQSANGRKQDD